MQFIAFILRTHPIHTVFIGFHPTLLYVATSWLVPPQPMVQICNPLRWVSLRNVSDFEQTTLLKIEVKIGWLKVGDFAQRVYHRVRSGGLYKDEIAVKIIVESFK